MPHISAPTAHPRRIPTWPSRQDIDRIQDQRARLIGHAQTMRQGGASSPFLDNAQQLLTGLWSGANWSARERLLKAAEWQVQLAQRKHANGTTAG